MLTDTQKAIRRTGIGSSDIAAIVGKSPYATPFDVWLSKTEGVEREATFATRLGDLLEDAVLTLYQERALPQLLERRPGTFRHPTRPLVVDSPDALAYFSTGNRVVEAKTSRFRDVDTWGLEGTDEVPEHYVIQCTWHLGAQRAITGDDSLVQCDLPVLLSADEFRLYRVSWNPELFGILLEEGERFWRDHVEARVAPSSEGSRTIRDWLKARFPEERLPVLDADEALEDLARRLRLAEEDCDDSERALADLQAQMQQAIGPAAGVQGRFGRVTWKRSKDTVGPDWKALAAETLEGMDAETRAALLARHTRTLKQGSRRFLASWAKDDATRAA